MVWPPFADHVYVNGVDPGTGANSNLVHLVPPQTSFYEATSAPWNSRCFAAIASANSGYTKSASSVCTTPITAPAAPFPDPIPSHSSEIVVWLRGMDPDVIEFADVGMSTTGPAGPFNQIKRDLHPVDYLRFSGLIPSASYCFRATATNVMGTSPVSAVRCVSTPSPPPCNPKKQLCPGDRGGVPAVY